MLRIGPKGRLWRRQASPVSRLGRWLEAALLLVLAVEVAQLIWAVATPTGPFGDWRAPAPTMLSNSARQALFATFDPFFRNGAAGPQSVQQVTSLPLQLYGIRVNEATGLGSAIIADETGVQRSYAVGEEIAPGVVLKAVDYDHVVITRGGVSENLFIDQSGSAPVVQAPPPTQTGALSVPAPSAPPPPASAGAGAQQAGGSSAMFVETLAKSVALSPRNQGGRVTGIVVQPSGNPELFARAGFQPGDIIAQVNGRPVSSAGDISSLQSSLVPGARISLMVERGAATVPIAIIIPDSK